MEVLHRVVAIALFVGLARGREGIIYVLGKGTEGMSMFGKEREGIQVLGKGREGISVAPLCYCF